MKKTSARSEGKWAEYSNKHTLAHEAAVTRAQSQIFEYRLCLAELYQYIVLINDLRQ